jgi:phosphate transport system protein
MADAAKLMVRKSLDALVNLNPVLAREVLVSDDTIDTMNRTMHEALQSYMKEQPEHVDTCMMLTSVSRNLERMADHATNIAEDVIYLVEGDIVRHGRGRIQE